VLVDDVANGGAARKASGRVAFTALHADVELGKITLFTLQFTGPLHIFLGLAAGVGYGLDVAFAFDRETLHRLAGFADAVHDPLRPSILDADDNDSRHVGVRARSDDGAEMQFQILAELQPAVGVRKRHRTADVARNRFASGVRDVVHGKNDDMIAHANATVFPAVRKNFTVACHAMPISWSSGCVCVHARQPLPARRCGR
jgi:hypothetical protein